MTEKLFVKDVYLKETEMLLTDKKLENGKLKLAFDKTVFYPEGGGQLCDTGFIGEYEVSDVKEEKGTAIIWHTVEKANENDFEIGKSYLGKLNWQERFSHMQMHAGEHIVSGVFLKLYNGANNGFYMGKDHVRIDIDLPTVTDEMLSNVEKVSNEVIWSDLPINTYFFKTLEEAKTLPLRKDIKAGENISVVVIGPKENMVDCCACCGTHPITTGQIGLVKIIKTEKYKGMTRLYIKIGQEALKDYTNRQKITDALSVKYSCEVSDIEKAIFTSDQKAIEINKKYSALKNSLLLEEEKKLNENISEKVYYYDYFSTDDLQLLANKLMGKLPDLVVFVSLLENSAVLAGNGTISCGELVKQYAPSCNGRGGGKPNLARAIFTNKTDLDSFIEKIK